MPENEEHVVLVDEHDNEIGTKEKIRAHQNGGILHRAFSIFIFNSKGDLMLQHRAKSKYHFGGLWTNTCCSHPKPGETAEEAGHRKLKQEMGFDTNLKEIFTFIYRAEFNNGLTEHEFDHVLVGTYDGKPSPNPEEAEGWKWVSLDELKKDIKERPEKYTPWLKKVLDQVIEFVKSEQL